MEKSLKLRACLDFWGNPRVLHEGALPVPDGRPMLLVHVCQGQNVEHVVLGADEGQLLGISSGKPAQPHRLVRVMVELQGLSSSSLVLYLLIQSLHKECACAQLLQRCLEETRQLLLASSSSGACQVVA